MPVSPTNVPATPPATPTVPPTAPTTPPPSAPAAPKPGGLGMHWDKAPDMALQPGTNYHAQLSTADGAIGVQLLAGAAPNAVNSIKFLADQGFYKNTPVHRMMPDFMMQFGDPTGTGTGGPGYMLKDDPVPDGWKYYKGVVAMANAGPDTAGSQMFIMLKDADFPMPPNYTIVGYVDQGVDVLDKIAKHPVGPNDQGEPSKPIDPLWIDDIKVTATPIDAAGQ